MFLKISKRNEMLKKDLEQTVKELKEVDKVNADIKISVYDINDRLSASVNGDSPGWAASIIKVPVMVEVARQIENKRFKLETGIPVNHRFILEKFDPLSLVPEGVKVPVGTLLYYMIVHSDNTATNMLANKVGINNINETMWELGMKDSMLGHLLCPKVPRYTSEFNPDGSNITTTDDMNTLLRHLYDPKFSKVSPFVSVLSDVVLSRTHSAYLKQAPFLKSKIKSKMGVIGDPINGRDIHEVGVIDDHLIVSIMLNKVDPYDKSKPIVYRSKYANRFVMKPEYSFSNTGLAYQKLMRVVGRHSFN